MRVLHVLDTLNWAGTERHVLTLAAAQVRAGAGRVAVACPDGSPLTGRLDGDGVGHVPIAAGSGPLTVAANGRHLRRAGGDFDLLHAHNGRCVAAAVGSGRPVVATQHFIAPASAGRRGVAGAASRVLLRRVTGRVRRWIAVSDAARRAMVDRGDAPAERIDLVHNGVDATPAHADRPETRWRLGVADDQALVLCPCRLEPEKDVATLVEAASRLAAPARVLVAGGGAERALLEAAATRSAAPVVFLGPRDDVPDLMAACDLVALPAPAEPFGLVLIEAMAAGRPVVACAAGGPPEIVDAGVTGLLVPPRDPAALAAAIDRLAASPGERRRMGDAGRARYAERFTAGAMEAATRRVYRRVLEGVRA